jgi:predicted NBD/HSP70 family sugar kinase
VYFLGIDIGKRTHEVALLDKKGALIGKKLFKFSTPNKKVNNSLNLSTNISSLLKTQ